MMGMYALIEDAREQEIAAAIEAANEWQKVGRPIIMAALQVERGGDELFDLFNAGRKRDYHEAKDYISSAAENLREMLDGLRDDFLCDQRKSWSSDLSDDDAEAVDAFNDELQEAVVSVRDLEKIVEREDYEAFLRGGR